MIYAVVGRCDDSPLLMLDKQNLDKQPTPSIAEEQHSAVPTSAKQELLPAILSQSDVNHSRRLS
jgi:hypothetical protein